MWIICENGEALNSAHVIKYFEDNHCTRALFEIGKTSIVIAPRLGIIKDIVAAEISGAKSFDCQEVM